MSDIRRICVVEDEESLNQNLVNALRKDNYDVQSVTRGADAILVLWAEAYDIVISALGPAETEGLELLQWLRAYRPETQMIIIGAARSAALCAQALEIGAASYLEKPLDLRVLKEEVHRLSQRSGFTASLDSFDLLDIVQIIHMSHKNITLVINTGLEEHGSLVFQDGELTLAEYGILRGEEAFFALAAHKNGMVTQRSSDEPVQANVTLPLSRLIFQALQYRSKYADRQQTTGEHEKFAVHPTSNFLFEEIDDTPFTISPEELPLSPVPPPYGMTDHLVLPTNRAETRQTDEVTVTPQFSSNGAALAGPSLTRLKSTAASAHTEGWAVEKLQEAKEWWQLTEPTEQVSYATALDTLMNGSGALNPIPQSDKPLDSESVGLPSWVTGQPTSQNIPMVNSLLSANGLSSAQQPTLPPLPVEWQSAIERLEHLSARRETAQSLSSPSHPDHYAFQQTPFTPVFWEQSELFGQPDQLPQTNNTNGTAQNGHTPPPPADAQKPRSGPSSHHIMPDGRHSEFSPDEFHTNEKYTEQNSSVNINGKYAKENNFLAPSPASANGHRHVIEDPFQDSDPMLSTASLKAQRVAGKRNQAALISALQTLGYSIIGFIASAVVSIDGHAVAQVAVDDLDISKICRYCSAIQKNALQALESSDESDSEETIISNSTRHILMRMIGPDKKAFLVLMTTREANPAESLEVMANVEGAISAALC